MSARFTPFVLLSGAVALGVALAALMLSLAMDRHWLGIDLARDDGRALIANVDPDGPARTIASPGVLVAVTGRGGERIEIAADDLVEEPDTLATYAAMRAFFERQDAIAEALGLKPVTIETRSPSGTQAHEIVPRNQRPATTLPPAFWIQIGVGLVGFWIGVWIWALRPGEWATRHLAIAGAGLMVSAFPAAVYSTRELAMPGDLFVVLSRFNVIGALIFGIGMIGLFLIYPRRIAHQGWAAAALAALALWQLLDMAAIWPGPGIGRHLPILLAMLAIVALIAAQFRATRGHPRDRAALTWLGLAVVVGAGAFVVTVIAPVVLGIGALMSQGEAFVFFLLIYVGVALGVARFQLFQLDEWAFRILFYVMGVVMLLMIDAALIVTIVDDRAPAFALSLLIVALVWLPLRDALARRMLRRKEPERQNLFRQVMDVALTPPGRDQQERWRALLENAFRPLSLAPLAGARAPALIDDGLALAAAGAGDLPAYRLDHADGGRKLFSPRDLELAAELSAMLANALESRAAYEKGVAEERVRIARDIHDNIGVQLMGALHSRGTARKDVLIRETLTDLRDIINNASKPDLDFEEMLADLRAQISEHLFAAGIDMRWRVDDLDRAPLPLSAAQAVRSIIREAVQNAVRHAAPTTIDVAVAREAQAITLSVIDDGRGFDVAKAGSGNGLANMQARAAGLAGRLAIASGPDGTRIEARFPLSAGRSGA